MSFIKKSVVFRDQWLNTGNKIIKIIFNEKRIVKAKIKILTLHLLLDVLAAIAHKLEYLTPWFILKIYNVYFSSLVLLW